MSVFFVFQFNWKPKQTEETERVLKVNFDLYIKWKCYRLRPVPPKLDIARYMFILQQRRYIVCFLPIPRVSPLAFSKNL